MNRVVDTIPSSSKCFVFGDTNSQMQCDIPTHPPRVQHGLFKTRILRLEPMVNKRLLVERYAKKFDVTSTPTTNSLRWLLVN